MRTLVAAGRIERRGGVTVTPYVWMNPAKWSQPEMYELATHVIAENRLARRARRPNVPKEK